MKERLERLNKAIRYLHETGAWHTKTDLAQTIGMERANLVRAIQGTPRYFTAGFLRRFLRAFGGRVNEAWLLRGEGDMIPPPADARPHVVDLDAAAGALGGIDIAAATEIHSLRELVPAYDFTIAARGESMLPEVHDGDLLLCRRLDRALHPADLGRIFVADTADGVLVKRLAAIDPAEGLVTLRSLNPDYPDIAAPASSLHALARVVAVVHPVAPAHDQKSN